MRKPLERTWSRILARAERGDAEALGVALKRIADVGGSERQRVLRAALTAAEARRDYTLLVEVLNRAGADLRADALALALGLANESHPRFYELTAALRAEERALLVGALLQASRLDSSPERRLLRLERLVRAVAPERRDGFWPEAQALAERGGDDAQLALLGFARRLPEQVRPRRLAALGHSVRRVREPFKRAMAFLALAELAPLGRDDLDDARSSAARIPDPTLRAAAAAQLDALEQSG